MNCCERTTTYYAHVRRIKFYVYLVLSFMYNTLVFIIYVRTHAARDKIIIDEARDESAQKLKTLSSVSSTYSSTYTCIICLFKFIRRY